MKKNIIIGVLCALLVGSGIWIYTLYDNAGAYKTRIENGSEDTFLGLKQRTEEMSEALKTAAVSKDMSHTAKKLAFVSKLAAEGSGMMTTLPISHNISSKVVDFFNVAEDYTYSMLCGVLSGNELSEENKQVLDNLSVSCEALSNDINLFHDGRKDDFLWYDKDYKFIAEEGGAFDNMFAGFLKSVENAPENNYDGIYSAHVTNDKENAENKSADAQKYEFSKNIPSAANISLEEAQNKAAQHVSESGIGDMKAVKRETYSNTAVFTFAYVKESVVYYPDSISVQVSLEDGSIMGYEASNYYKNHTDRQIPVVRLSVQEAAAMISERLTVEKNRLIVVHSAGGAELVCYEFKCGRDDEKYLVYIDANSGKETDIMLLKEDEGSEVLYDGEEQ